MASRRPAISGAFVLVIAVLGCGDDDPAMVPENVELASCGGLDACTCAATSGCAPLATDCWCESNACGGTDACACSGGHYLGCAPTGGRCHVNACTLLSTPTVDADGCMPCAPPPDCATALARLSAACPDLAPAQTSWICEGGLDTCATFCLGQIRNCGEATCTFAAVSECSSDTLDSCLSECLSSAQSRR